MIPRFHPVCDEGWRTFAQYPAYLGLGRPAWLARSCRGGGLALAMGEEPNARARPSFERNNEGENPALTVFANPNPRWRRGSSTCVAFHNAPPASIRVLQAWTDP